MSSSVAFRTDGTFDFAGANMLFAALLPLLYPCPCRSMVVSSQSLYPCTDLGAFVDSVMGV